MHAAISGSWRSWRASFADKAPARKWRTDSTTHISPMYGKCGEIRRNDRHRFSTHRQAHGSLWHQAHSSGPT